MAEEPIALPGASDLMQESECWRNVLREEHLQLRNDQRRQLREHASAVERMLQQQQAFLQRTLSMGSAATSANIRSALKNSASIPASPAGSRRSSQLRSALVSKTESLGGGHGRSRDFDDVVPTPTRKRSLSASGFGVYGSDQQIKVENTDEPHRKEGEDEPKRKMTVNLDSVLKFHKVEPIRNSCALAVECTHENEEGFHIRHTWNGQEPQSLTLQLPSHEKNQRTDSDGDEDSSSHGSGDSSIRQLQDDKDEASSDDDVDPNACSSPSSQKTRGSGTSVNSYEKAELERAEWQKHIKISISKHIGSKKRTSMMAWVSNEKNCAARFVERRAFSTVCAVVIVLNALFVGLDTDVSMRMVLQNPDEPELPWFKIVHRCFNSFFLVELILRIYAYQTNFFIGTEWRWNYFDVLLVGISIIEEVVQVIDFGSLRVLRGVRMARVLRLMRVMRFFRELRLMIYSIVQSFFALSWALLVLIVLMYLFGIVVMQGATLHLRELDHTGLDSVRVIADSRYSNMFETMLTLLACITSGVDWNDASRPLGEISWIYELLFGFYITFVVIGVLNVLTGIFVERASELHGLDRDLVIQAELRRNECFFTEMKKIFEEADLDGSNTISWEEFRDYLKNKEVRAYLATQQLDAYDARQLFNILDLEDGQEIGIEEFIMGCARLRGLAKSVDVVALLQESRQFHAKVRKHMGYVEEELETVKARVEGDFSFQPLRGSRRISSALRPSTQAVRFHEATPLADWSQHHKINGEKVAGEKARPASPHRPSSPHRSASPVGILH